MKPSTLTLFALGTAASPLLQSRAPTLNPGPTFTRLDKNDSMVLVVDLQEGLYQAVRDFDPVPFRTSIIGHASLAQLFSLPVILTTSAETGPNGPLPKEILDLYPSAPMIRRQGEVNAWDNSDFRSAVRAENKSQIILAGITTDVCTEFLALSLIQEGYTVFANTEASGAFDKEGKLARDANRRMEKAGVVLQGLFAIAMDLMRDWRASPGSKEVLPWLDQYLPVYTYVARGHEAAVVNGSLAPGEAGLKN